MFFYRRSLLSFIAAWIIVPTLTICGTLSAGPRAAPAQEAAGPAAVLAVLPRLDAPTPDPSSAHYDFGRVESFNIPVIHHLFALRNMTSRDVVVSSIQTSPECTGVPILPGSPAGRAPASPDSRGLSLPDAVALPYSLLPGRNLLIDATVNLAWSRSGKTRKFVWILVNGERRPAATLELSGENVPPMTVSPRVLNFGDVPFGKGRSLQLKLTIERSALARNVVDGFITAGYVGARIDPAPHTDEEPPTGGAAAPKEATIVRTITVILVKEAPIGRLTGTIEAALRPTDRPSGIVAGRMLPDAWGSPPIPLIGRVVGPVSSSLDRLDFGTVRQGQSKTIGVLLRGSVPPGGIVTVKYLQRWLSVRVTAPDSSPSPDTRPALPAGPVAPRANTFIRRLEVTLDADKAPAGPSYSGIIVNWSDSVSLQLPVTSNVVATVVSK